MVNASSYKITIAAVILTHNSEKTIARCLNSLEDAVDEIVVVDTGSTDETVAIVKSLGTPVHTFDWVDDFSAARNYASTLVSSRWVFWIDSDEVLFHEDKELIRASAKMYDNISIPFALQVNIINKVGSKMQSSTMVRMYLMNRGLQWNRPIHEELVTENREDLRLFSVNIRLLHEGYDSTVVDVHSKYLRNIRLLERHVNEEPNNAITHAYLSRENLRIGNVDKAIYHGRLAKELLTKSKSYTIDHLLAIDLNVAFALEQTGEAELAEKQALQITADYPEFVDGWYLYGFYQMKKAASLQLAKQYLEIALNMVSSGKPMNDSTIGSFKALLHLADINRLSGNWLQARRLYKEVLKQIPDYTEVRNILSSMEQQILKLAEELNMESD